MEIVEDPHELAEELGPAADGKIGPFVAVASIALNMAMKYHDISTVQDGQLYQQYKLEGRNMREIGLADVFETAIQIEQHLVRANKRVAAVLIDVLTEADEPVAVSPETPNET